MDIRYRTGLINDRRRRAGARVCGWAAARLRFRDTMRRRIFCFGRLVRWSCRGEDAAERVFDATVLDRLVTTTAANHNGLIAVSTASYFFSLPPPSRILNPCYVFMRSGVFWR